LIGNRGFIYRREIKKRIKNISDLLEEGKAETAGKEKSGNENNCSLLGMTYITWKERQISGSLFEKTELEKRNISLCKKIGY